VNKRARLLNPNQISKLIMDSDSDEPQCDVAAMEDEEYCEEILLKPHLRSHSEYIVCSSAQAPLSPDSASTSENDDDVQSGPDPQTQQPPKSQWHCPLVFRHKFKGAPEERTTVKHPHINDGFTPLSVFMLYFTEIVTLLMVETNRYCPGAWTVFSVDLLPKLM
jgi:hypothetical protein